MRTIQRILGAYAFLLALAVAVHFVVTPVYDDGTTGYPVWAAFDWFMAPAVVLACAASLVWKLDLSNGGAEIPDARRSLEVNTLFIRRWYSPSGSFPTGSATSLAAKSHCCGRSSTLCMSQSPVPAACACGVPPHHKQPVIQADLRGWPVDPPPHRFRQ